MKATITIDVDDGAPVVVRSTGNYLLSRAAAGEILIDVAKQVKSGRLIMSREHGGRIYAPFTVDQVRALNEYQTRGRMHPFTCEEKAGGLGGPVHPADSVLKATIEGWFCPVDGCSYSQNWAHSFMADGTAVTPQ